MTLATINVIIASKSGTRPNEEVLMEQFIKCLCIFFQHVCKCLENLVNDCALNPCQTDPLNILQPWKLLLDIDFGILVRINCSVNIIQPRKEVMFVLLFCTCPNV